MHSSVVNKHFLLTLTLLCLAYLGVELFFNHYAMLSVDEFWFAHRIYQYKDSLPYRDFAPYKTVLGYYLLLPALLVPHSILASLIFVKDIIAVGNTIILFSVTWYLTRYFSKAGALAGLGVLLLSEIFLSYSTNLRVDLPAYWLGLFAILCLLEERYFIAGLLLGLGFCTSQKTVWYIAALNAAMFAAWLYARYPLRDLLLKLSRFNGAAFLTILSYLVVWASLTNLHTVWFSVFTEAKIMYELDWYNHARLLFWSLIVLYNPLLYLTWPLAMISLMVTYTEDHRYQTRLFISVFACTILFMLIPYKQVFPYYMQVTFPAFLLLYTAVFTWLFGLIKTKQPLHWIINKYFVLAFFAIYTGLLLYAHHLLHLPMAYWLIITIPLSLCLLLLKHASLSRSSYSLLTTLLTLSTVFIGGIYPAILFAVKIVTLDGRYQKANIEALETLLQDGSGYVAGIELLYNKTQPIAGMRHLHGPAIDYLYEPTEKLRPAMLASLYQDPHATGDIVLTHLQQSTVKLYVNNYRMMALPPNIKQYFESNYEHLWGSLYLYAPTINAGKQFVEIKFSGEYKIESPRASSITLDHHRYQNSSVIHIEKGNHASAAPASYRLKLMPAESALFNKAFQSDEWRRVLI